jgi:capsular polysaccharide biosynthesis protein
MSIFSDTPDANWSYLKDGAICPHCLNRLFKKGVFYVEILSQICRISRTGSSFAYLPRTENYIATIVKLLESDQHIVTTEFNESIELARINPVTTFFIHERGYYCWCHWPDEQNDNHGINGVDFNGKG